MPELDLSDVTVVFKTENGGGSYLRDTAIKPDPDAKCKTVTIYKDGQPFQVLRYELKEGVCAAYTGLWIRRTFERGDLTAVAEFGDKEKVRQQLEIVQGATNFWQGGFSVDRLLEANRLKATGRETNDFFDKEEMRGLIGKMVADPGCYFFVIDPTLKGKSGHAVGFKTGPSGCFLFDCNAGLIKFEAATFVKKAAKVLWECYKDLYPAKLLSVKCTLD